MRLEYTMGEKNTLFNKWCWENWTFIHESIKLDYSLTPRTRISLKWIKNLSVRPEVINLEESIGSIHFDTDLYNIFSYVSSGKGSKSKSKQTGQHQTKEFWQAKGTISKMKKTPSDWEEIFANNINKKGLIYKIYRKTQFSIKKPHTNGQQVKQVKDIQHY